MASATGIPGGPVVPRDVTEDEPLLGRPGGASQQEGKPLWHNLFIGTAVIAQAGIILLVVHIWASILLMDISLFTAHPLLNSAGILFLTQGILILQPTHTPDQKRTGTAAHFIINILGVDALIAGLIIIEVNKFKTGHAHFTSVHGILGLTTYIILAIQAIVGFTQYYTPSLYGSVDNAKSIYKYHRASGYVVLVLLFSTVAAATLQVFITVKLWAVLICGGLVLVGVIPRIQKRKFGFGSTTT